jgi:hypothetical protein
MDGPKWTLYQSVLAQYRFTNFRSILQMKGDSRPVSTLSDRQESTEAV